MFTILIIYAPFSRKFVATIYAVFCFWMYALTLIGLIENLKWWVVRCIVWKEVHHSEKSSWSEPKRPSWLHTSYLQFFIHQLSLVPGHWPVARYLMSKSTYNKNCLTTKQRWSSNLRKLTIFLIRCDCSMAGSWDAGASKNPISFLSRH